MPIIQHSTYAPPSSIFKNRHWNTIYPSLFRRVKNVHYQRERITTPDDDFIDLDWIMKAKNKVVIICHGLEGKAESAYVKGMAKIFAQNDWSVCAYNYRGCSGEPNKQIRAYHSGATDDLELVIQTVLSKKFETIALVGFSLGGNLVLKYTGEQGANINPAIKKTAALSTPVHLESSSEVLQQPHNWLYMKRFASKLRKKIKSKEKILEQGGFDVATLLHAKTFKVFDELFTAKAHGFSSRIDYYTKCSSLQFLENIAIPTLLINAEDDPFLSSECFPKTIASNHQFFYLETPKHGGHVGFTTFGNEGTFWSERRVFEFVNT